MFLEKYPALRYRDFRLWWFGQFISNTGTQMQFVAINWQLYLLTHSAFALGLVGLVRIIPIIGFAFVSGLIADKYNRKIANAIAQIVLAILSFVLVCTTFTHTITPLLIYTITFFSAIAVSFEIPTRQALVPSLVEKKDLPNAMNLVNMLKESSTIAGPALAGFLIVAIGVGNIYLLNFFSFFAVIIALCLVTSSGEITGVPSTLSVHAIKDGITFITSKTILWSTLLLDFLSTFFSGATALLPIFAKDILHVGPQGLGLLYAAPSVGAILAAIIVSHMGKMIRQGKLLLYAITIYAVGTILFGFSKIFPLSLIALGLVGGGDAISTIIRSTIRQVITPDYLRGRMVALSMIFVLGGPQLGDFEAGMIAGFTSAPLSVVSGGMITLVVVAIVSFVLPVLREYE